MANILYKMALNLDAPHKNKERAQCGIDPHTQFRDTHGQKNHKCALLTY